MVVSCDLKIEISFFLSSLRFIFFFYDYWGKFILYEMNVQRLTNSRVVEMQKYAIKKSPFSFFG